MTILLATLLMAASPRTFHIDALHGSDSSPGTIAKPWRSLARVAKETLQPHDKLLLAGGQTFQGPLKIGKEANGVTLASYGKGRAKIDGGAGDGIVIDGCADVYVTEIDVVGSGRKASDGAGVRIERSQRVRLEDMDISGFRVAGVEMNGVAGTSLENVAAHHNGAAGISVIGGYDGTARSKDVTIQNCKAFENAGDPKNLTNHSGNGIVVGGVDSCSIRLCEAYRNGWDMPRKGNGPVGIWAWNASHVLIERCISRHNDSPGTDGGGFDFDGGVTDSVMQYNLSYENAGCGYLLCQYEGGGEWKNNVVRYNFSYNDGAKNFQCGIGIYDGGGKFSDAEITNNTIVNEEHAVVATHRVPGLTFRKNIFVAGKDAILGDFSPSRFEKNLYQTSARIAAAYEGKEAWPTLAEWAKATGQEMEKGEIVGYAIDAKLRLPTKGERLPTDPAQLSKMTLLRPEKDSLARAFGLGVPDPELVKAQEGSFSR
ncbi:hypothetical protein BH11ARM2_BH11ARM2_39030 [soil metagenome]